ncbi:MAG: methylenetetrahydrofolate reductase C-terminal domain-containing protein [Ilumatobacter sp.]
MSDECPKAMIFGPCGGVRNDGSCEVDARPCPFLGAHVTPPAPERANRLELSLDKPAIVVDVRAPPRWSGDHELLWRATADALQGCVALIGEHVDNAAGGDDSGALPAQRVIKILRDAGVGVIATVTGRDRDLLNATELIHAYRDAGVTAIHCVTGDHPAAVGIDRPARFGAEAITLIAASLDAGVPATVGESPASAGRRTERLALKQSAGAALCLLNHAGEADDLIVFADASRAAGVVLPLIAPVPMVADRHAALGLAAFPGLRLPHGFLDEIIDASDPLTAGLDASREFIRACAMSTRFAGINLSGAAGGLDPWDRLRLTSRFIEQARAELVGSPTTPGRHGQGARDSVNVDV